MKKITKSEIEKMIRKEYKEARRWCRLDNRHTYKMMIDTSDASIWIDVFLDKNSWKNYRSNTISCLTGSGVYATVAETEAAYLADAIEKLQDAGWGITD